MIFPPSLKISFRAIVLLWPRPAHSIRCNFTNNMSGSYPVGFIDAASYSVNGDAEGPEFIWCMDRREPQVREVWTFGEDGVMREVHPID